MATKPQMAPEKPVASPHPHLHQHARWLMWVWYTIIIFLALLVFTPKAGGFGTTTASVQPTTMQG